MSFKKKNNRRCELAIKKCSRRGLTEKEAVEYKKLTEFCMKWINERHPMIINPDLLD